jgi:hypothetical protein
MYYMYVRVQCVTLTIQSTFLQHCAITAYILYILYVKVLNISAEEIGSGENMSYC